MLFCVPMNVAGEGLQTEELRLAPTALEHRTSAFVVSPEPSPLKNTEGPYLPGSSRGKSRHDKKTPLYSLNYFCTILSMFISKMLLISKINGDKTQLNYHICIFLNAYEKNDL